MNVQKIFNLSDEKLSNLKIVRGVFTTFSYGKFTQSGLQLVVDDLMHYGYNKTRRIKKRIGRN